MRRATAILVAMAILSSACGSQPTGTEALTNDEVAWCHGDGFTGEDLDSELEAAAGRVGIDSDRFRGRTEDMLDQAWQNVYGDSATLQPSDVWDEYRRILVADPEYILICRAAYSARQG